MSVTLVEYEAGDLVEDAFGLKKRLAVLNVRYV